MKIAFNKPIVDSAYGGSNHFLQMLYDYLKANGCTFVDYKKANVLFVTGTREYNTKFWIEEIKAIKKRSNKVRVVFRINDCDKPRGTNEYDDNVKELLKYTDVAVFVSKWCEDYYCSKDIVPYGDSCVIPNLPNTSLFRPDKKKLGGILSIVTHHYSDNKQKGMEYYEYLNNYCSKNLIAFKYIGNCPKDKLNTWCDKIKPQKYEDLPYYLNDADLYITAAYAESGANHIMEGVCCGLVPVVHAHGGSTVEYTDGINHTFTSKQGMIAIINQFKGDNNFLAENRKRVLEFIKNKQHIDMLKKYYQIVQGSL